MAIPVIEFSQVLTDDDLVEIINASDAAKPSAVARRAPSHGAKSSRSNGSYLPRAALGSVLN